jgi:hypothetical protein
MTQTETRCRHPIKDVIWIGEWQENVRSAFNPFIVVERTVRRLLCLGCGREFEVEVIE